jgi:hypothetical protein
MQIRNALRKRREIKEEKKVIKIEGKNIAFVNSIARMSQKERNALHEKLVKKMKKVDERIERLKYQNMVARADKREVSQTLYRVLMDNYAMEKKYLKWQINEVWRMRP